MIDRGNLISIILIVIIGDVITRLWDIFNNQCCETVCCLYTYLPSVFSL